MNARVNRRTYVDEARAAWGGAPEAWIVALAECADRDGVKAVAVATDYSATTVYEVIRAQYKGSLANVEAAVRAALMRDFVACPVLGQISGAACLQAQGRKARPVNSTQVKLARRCPACAYRKGQ
ncbi:transcriptional regulator [Zavarzinia sp.]|uniref:transcriptional regulator n=1 Tax=Zavarzinia sp. TaxID=2027920 RepID=UPI003BB7EF0A